MPKNETLNGRKKKIVICGAGTAGLSLAYLLAKHRDCDVSLLERNNTYAYRYGRSIQAIRNYDQPVDILQQFEELGLSLPGKIFYPIFRQVRVFPDGKPIIISMRNRPTFYVFQRGPRPGSLDHFFFSMIKKNVKVDFNKHVDSLNNIDGDIIVGARGSKIGEGKEILKGYEFQGHSKSFPPNTIAVLFDNDIAPGGYVAIIPYPLAGGKFAISIPVAWDTTVAPLPADPMEIIEKIIQNPYIRENFLGDFVCTGHLASFGQWGRVYPPSGKKIFIGEEFGALEGGLAYGNSNSILTSIAAYKAIRNGSVEDFMGMVQSYGVIDSIREGIARRSQLRAMNNFDFITIKESIVNKCGEDLPYELYVKYKNRWIFKRPLKLLQFIIDKLVAYNAVHI